MCSQLPFSLITPPSETQLQQQQKQQQNHNYSEVPSFISNNFLYAKNAAANYLPYISSNRDATKSAHNAVIIKMSKARGATIPNTLTQDSCCTIPSSSAEDSPLYDVFLGGSCGSTVWRQDLVIPYLKKRGITYYDPQRPVWSENLVHEEAAAKENSKLFLFVLDPGNINATSFLEIAYLAARKASKLVVVFLGRREWSDKAHPMDLPDRIRTCNLLEAILKRHSVPMLTSITEALDCVDEMIIGEQSWRRAISNPLQRMPYIHVKSTQLIRKSCRTYKRLRTRLRTRFFIYLRRAGAFLFIEVILALLLIFCVFKSWPVWTIITPFIAIDYLLIIISIIYCRFRTRQKHQKVEGKLIISGTPIPRMTESASLIKPTSKIKSSNEIITPSTNNGIYATKVWHQTLSQMPYSTSLPSDISSRNSSSIDDELCKSPLEPVPTTTLIKEYADKSKTKIADSCQYCNNKCKAVNGISNNELDLTSLLGQQLEKSASLVDSEVRMNMHCSDRQQTLCLQQNIASPNFQRRQRRETIATSTASDSLSNDTQDYFVSAPDQPQIECRNCFVDECHFMNGIASPVGYDVFLSCSSSSELDWITQQAVPQLHKNQLSYTSALMCDKEMRIPMLHTASHILYYIPSYKTFLSGMIEIAYFIGHWDWQVTVCVPSEAKCLILLDENGELNQHDPQTISAVERRNECYRMAFCYLKDMARRRQCRVFTKVEDAIKHIANDKSRSCRKRCGGARLRQIVEKQHLVKSGVIDSPQFLANSSISLINSQTIESQSNLNPF